MVKSRFKISIQSKEPANSNLWFGSNSSHRVSVLYSVNGSISNFSKDINRSISENFDLSVWRSTVEAAFFKWMVPRRRWLPKTWCSFRMKMVLKFSNFDFLVRNDPRLGGPITFWQFDIRRTWPRPILSRRRRKRRADLQLPRPIRSSYYHLLHRRRPRISSYRNCSISFSGWAGDRCFHIRRNWTDTGLDNGWWRFLFGRRNPRPCRPASRRIPLWRANGWNRCFNDERFHLKRVCMNLNFLQYLASTFRKSDSRRQRPE